MEQLNSDDRQSCIQRSGMESGKTLLFVDNRFRRLNGPKLLREVKHGVRYADGVRVKEINEEAAA